MHTTPTAVERLASREIAAALAVGSVGLLMPGLQPALLGELVAKGRITLEGVGLLAMGEILAIGVGVIAANACLPLARLRTATALAALVAAVVDLATTRLAGDTALTLARALAGLAEGVLVWIATCAIVRSPAPDRLAAIFLVVQTLAQAAVVALLAALVIPAGGWQAGFVLLAALNFALGFALPVLPARLEPLGASGTARSAMSVGGAAALLVAFGQMAAIGTLWAFLDPLGRSAGLGAQAVGLLITAVLLVQVAGGIVASMVVHRVPTAATLGTVLLLQAAMTWGIARATGAPVRFVMLCLGFGFLWLFSLPFHVRLAFYADAAGRVAAFVPGAQLLGVACGPLLTSFLVEGSDPRPVPYASAAFALFAALVLGAAHKSLTAPPRARPSGTEPTIP